MSSFSLGDTSKIIELLRNNIYKHPIQTLVQEYISNARDAHREAGVTKKIKVQVPTISSDVFAVRDFGPGLSPELIENVFIKYGNTTKTGNDGQTGGFGIGAKSAWAYTDKFTITSICKGIERVYEAIIDDKNSGQLNLLSELPSDEASGTKISIDITYGDHSQFAQAILRSTFFWKYSNEEIETSEVLMPEFSDGDVIDLSDKTKLFLDLSNTAYIMHKANIPHNCLVIDGIPYEIDSSLMYRSNTIEKFFRNITGARATNVVFVDNGLIRVAASREGISTDNDNIKAIESILDVESNKITSDAVKTFAAVKNFNDFAAAHQKHIHWELGKDTMFKDLYEYNAQRETFSSSVFRNISINRCRLTKAGSLKKNHSYSISLDDFDSLYVSVPEESVHLTNKRLKIAMAKGLKPLYVTEKIPTSFELSRDINRTQLMKTAWASFQEDFNVKTLDAFPLPEKQKTDRKKRKSNNTKAKTEVSIRTINRGSVSFRNRLVVNIASNTTKIVYFLSKERKQYVDNIHSLISMNKKYDIYTNTVFAGIGVQDIKKIVDDDNFITFEDFVDGYNVPKAFYRQYILSGVNNHRFANLTNFWEKAGKQIKDPRLRKMVATSNIIKKDRAPYGNVKGRLPKVIQHRFDKKYDLVKTEFEKYWLELESTLDNYTLLDIVARSRSFDPNIDDLVLYINAKYEASK